MNKVLETIIDHYSQRTGLSPTALSYQVWEQALADRMQKNQITNEWDYYQKWLNSHSESQHFFDRLVVLETWFFRNEEAFKYLSNFAFNEWYPKNKNKSTMRLLSVPCSTGEESYSMAMSLMISGFPTRMFAIDAVDICQAAIAKAELGIYGKNSFRNKEFTALEHYFNKIAEGYKINPSVQQQVAFRTGNVFDYGFMSTKPKYDVIFCRNLLIYLHPEAQNNLLQILRNMLLPGGVVFVGATEGELLRKFGFIQAPSAKASAFYNVEVASKKSQRIPKKAIPEKADPEPTFLIQNFEKAKHLADEGLFEEAISECLDALQQHGPTAEGYSLLAVIMHALNRKERAEEFFRKALYLDPEYHEALVYMALLAEGRGQQEEAQQYRARIIRIEGTKAAKQ